LRLFDRDVCEAFYERIKDSGNEAKVTKVTYKRKTKAKPIPMNTIEFQKLASRKLKIGSSKAMEIAEKLYNKGFISYPRTETNIFPEMNLREIVVELSKNSVFGDYANKILEVKGFYGPPKKGKLDDKAHPPIHPVKNAE
jgi:DNA topoisomerase III